jgi:hypothetical protein
MADAGTYQLRMDLSTVRHQSSACFGWYCLVCGRATDADYPSSAQAQQALLDHVTLAHTLSPDPQERKDG